MDTRLPDQNFGAKHFSCTVSSSIKGIFIAIRRIFGKVVCISPHTISTIGHIEALFTFIDIYRRCTTGPMIHLSLRSMLSPSMLSGNVIDLILINPPQLLVLDPLNTFDLCLRHGKLEISLQSSPLIGLLSNVLDHYLVVACQQFHRVLPIIREVVGLSFVDYLRYLYLDFVVLEPNNLEVIVRLGLNIDDVAISRVLLLDLVLDLCKELVGDRITINY
jgi:hypothetical protein